MALNNAAVAWAIGGDLIKTRELFSTAVAAEMAQRHGNLSRLALYQANLAECDWNDGALAPARDRAQASIEAARKSGDQYALNIGLATLAQILGELGDAALTAEAVRDVAGVERRSPGVSDVIGQ